jgi:hypothetical protein
MGSPECVVAYLTYAFLVDSVAQFSKQPRLEQSVHVAASYRISEAFRDI